MPNLESGVSAVARTKERRAREPQNDSFLPFDNGIINPVLVEKCENLLGDIGCQIGRGVGGRDADPDNGGAKAITIHFVQVVGGTLWPVCVETASVNA